MQTGAATVENSKELTQKIPNELPYDPADSTSGNLSQETQNTNSKAYMHPHAHCSITYNSQDLEVAQVSISKLADKKVVVH